MKRHFNHADRHPVRFPRPRRDPRPVHGQPEGRRNCLGPCARNSRRARPHGSRRAHRLRAASLTKPVVSFIALQLVERVSWTSTRRCNRCVLAAWKVMTIRLDNGRACPHAHEWFAEYRERALLKIYYPPGDRFNYGSSAFGWLQRAMESTTGRSLEQLAQERVFEVFGTVRDSSLHWQERFEANYAQGHEQDGQPVAKRRPATGAASWSLHTTAGDYARFIKAVVSCSRPFSRDACPLVRSRHPGERGRRRRA